MERGRLINVVERRRQADVQGKSIPVRTEIIRVAKAVTEILRGTGAEITGPRDVFEICMELDRITVAPEIQELFRVARREVLATIFEELANEKNGTIGRGDVDKVREREAQRNLWRATSKLMNSLNELQPDSFGPQWIREKLPEIYVEITAAIRNPLNETLEWEKLIETLPQAFQSRFTSKKKLEKVRGAEDDIEIYRSVAEALGSEALAEFLSLLKGGRNFGHRLNIVRRYLGKSAPTHFTYRKFAELPAAAIENPDFRKLVAVRLRNKLYSDMLTEGDDLDKEKAKLGQIRSEAFGYIDGVRTAHVELLDEVVGRFRSALEIKSPQRLVSKVADKDGSIHSFPSLRQRFAMSQIDRNNGGSGKLLVSFFMGKGKTATAFLTKEHVGAKRMLFTCPKPDLVTQTAARVPKYYRKGQEPEIGTIQAGMSQEAIAEELKKEVVIVPFTMFSSKLNGGTLVDALKKENFDMMVVDEAHNARNEDGHYSRSIKELAYGIRGLYDKGYIMLLSGDPVPNTPDDIAAHLGIADREKFAEVESLAAALKRVDPLKLRNALLDFMLILDPPEQWQEYVEALPLELSKEESVIYDSVIEDESLPAHEKVRRLRMAILNPAMVDASFAGTGTMADSIAERMIEDFEGESVTLFAEPSYKLGVFRPDPKQEEVPTMVDHVKETLKQDCLFLQCTSDLTPAAISKFAEEAAKKKKIPVMLAIYDGDTRKRERDTIKDISKNVGEMGVKMVIFAMAGTIREGIDLSHINRAYLLAPEFNQPDVAQFVKRFRREGNDRAQIGVFIAPGTVLEGIHLHAQQKAILCDALKYGNVVSQVELGMVDDSDGEVKLNQGGVVFGTHFAGALLSPQARLRSTLHFLKGKNASEYQEFIDADGEKYAKLYARYWEFSDSAQVGRLTSAVLSDLIAKGLMDKTATIADVASGPMVLANTLGARQGGVTIHSYDMNQHMLTEGALLKAKRFGDAKGLKAYVSRMENLMMDGVKAENELYDCVNLGDALSYTEHNPFRKNPAADERARVIMEQCRVLKKGGILTITLPVNACSEEQFTNLQKELANFGLVVLPEYSGTASSGDKKRDFMCNIITARKKGDVKYERIKVSNLELTPKMSTLEVAVQSGEQIVSSFNLNEGKIRFTTPADEKLKGEVTDYESGILRARQMLRQIMDEREIGTLTGEQKKTIKRAGIVLDLPEGGRSFWKFALATKPDRKHKIYVE